jgi:seryl-tRNA synthetase
MSTLYDAEGNPIEAYLPEEVETLVTKEREGAVEEANKLREEEVQTLVTEKEALEAEKVKLEERISGLDSKDQSFKILRGALDKKEDKIAELEEKIGEMGEEVNNKIAEISGKMLEDVRNDLFEAITGNNKEIKEKVAYYYDKFEGEPKTKEEMKERMENAYILATGGKGRISLSGDIVSGAIGNSFIPRNDAPTGKLSDQSTVEVAKKLGITTEELKRNGLI